MEIPFRTTSDLVDAVERLVSEPTVRDDGGSDRNRASTTHAHSRTGFFLSLLSREQLISASVRYLIPKTQNIFSLNRI